MPHEVAGLTLAELTVGGCLIRDLSVDPLYGALLICVRREECKGVLEVGKMAASKSQGFDIRPTLGSRGRSGFIAARV